MTVAIFVCASILANAIFKAYLVYPIGYAIYIRVRKKPGKLYRTRV